MENDIKERYIFINILKVCAAVLIINSHYDNIYPIAVLATGGAIGNAIFFAVSGFCLYPINKKFEFWYLKKIINIYIPTIIMTVISLTTYLRDLTTQKNYIFLFLWPTPFWFVGAMSLFYFLYFLLRKIETNKQFSVLFFVLIVIYILYYIFLLDKTNWVIETNGLDTVEGYFKLIYYFAIMMVGKWFKINYNKIKKRKYYSIGLFVSFFSIYGVKALISLKMKFMYLQFLNQVSILFFVIFLFMLCISYEELFLSKQSNGIFLFFNNMSKITLELYLVQFITIHYFSNIIFPLNFIVVTLSILLFAMVLSFFSKKLLIYMMESRKG